jgi:hypothetical protein
MDQPFVLRKAEPDLPPDASNWTQRARDSTKLSSHWQADRSAANCSAKKIRQKIVDDPDSKSGTGISGGQ